MPLGGWLLCHGKTKIELISDSVIQKNRIFFKFRYLKENKDCRNKSIKIWMLRILCFLQFCMY